MFEADFLPLNTFTPEIRLLRLHPSPTSSSTLQGTLVHASLDTSPVYKALSYTWGDQTKEGHILISNRLVTITAELESTFRSLRHGSNVLVLWIDALCINQADLTEKSQQVSLMRRIYRSAEEVIVWLGDPAKESDVAFDLLERIGEYERLAGSTDDGETDMILHGLQAISYLLERRWWSRMWTLQELVLARSAILQCGTRKAPWKRFDQLHKLLNARIMNRSGQPAMAIADMALAWCDKKDFLNVAQLKQVYDTGGGLGFAQLLLSTKTRQSSEPRDRVYALLSLVDGTVQKAIQPDYEKSVPEVFVQTSKLLLMSRPYLDGLQLSEGRPRSKGMPSWCTDFSAPPRENSDHPLLEGAASGRLDGSRYSWSHDGKTLLVEGYQFAVVQFASKYAPAPGARDDFSRSEPSPLLCEWRKAAQRSPDCGNVYQGDKGVAQAFYLSLCAGHDITVNPAFSNEPTLKVPVDDAGEAWFKMPSPQANDQGCQRITEAQDKVAFGKGMAYRSTALRHLLDRSFFITPEGFLGIGPSAVREGDVLASVLGASTAVCLRPRGDEKYEWIGAAWVPGVMRGEMLRWHQRIGRAAQKFVVE